MRKACSFLFAFLLIFGISPIAHASSEEPSEHVLHISHRPDGEGKWVFTARIEGEEKVRGDWSFVLDGHDATTVEFAGGQAQAAFTISSPGKHQLNVSFKGSLGDRTGRLTKEYIFDVPSLSVKIDGSKTISTTLYYAESAKGQWSYVLGTENGAVVEIVESRPGHGPRFSGEPVNLRPGTYTLLVAFQGEINGVETGFQQSLRLHVDEQGNLALKPHEEAGEPPAVITAPEKVAQIIHTSKQGGKLPKTATPHPAHALIGLVLLIGGWALLRVSSVKRPAVQGK